jgi:hypothetical protein
MTWVVSQAGRNFGRLNTAWAISVACDGALSVRLPIANHVHRPGQMQAP